MCLARTSFQLHRRVEGRGRRGWNVSGLLPLVAPPGHTTHTWYRHTHARAQTYIRLFLHRLPVSCWLNRNGGDRDRDLQLATCASIQSLGFSTDRPWDSLQTCGARLIDTLPVQTGNAFLWCAFRSLRATLQCKVFVWGETTDGWRYLLITVCGMQPTSLRTASAPCRCLFKERYAWRWHTF